jgi:hygromycin-B 7''-O-kinase
MNLPLNPSYKEVCELIDHQSDGYWLPAIEKIASMHQQPTAKWIRVREGGNVIFRHDNIAIKLIPQNWNYQGKAEIQSLGMLTDALPVERPRLLHHGVLDGWIYLIITWLPGISLAEVWGGMSYENKKIIVGEVGEFLDTLHQLPINKQAHQLFHWPEYHQKLLNGCLARHKRNRIPEALLEQVEHFLSLSSDYFDDGEAFLIHMDIHPWNLMAVQRGDVAHLSGVLDFGDAVIGRSQLIELATPIIFLCQGDAQLVNQLLESYGRYQVDNQQKFQQNLMATVLIRPDCDLNFVMSQVPYSGPRETWEQVAEQLFPY